MALQKLFSAAAAAQNKTFNGNKVTGGTEILRAEDVEAPSGLLLDNPLLEYILGRRFLPYGRFMLLYGDKGSAKTTFLIELGKLFIQNKGEFFLIETEHAEDLDYYEKLGLAKSSYTFTQPKNFEESLTLLTNIAQLRMDALAQDDPEAETPLLIGFDGVASNTTAHEQEQEVVGATKPGEHAKLLSGFFRRTVRLLDCTNTVIAMTNQKKQKISSMGHGDKETMIGGEAIRFHPTYQWKFARVGDIMENDPITKQPVKVGTLNSVRVVRAKLGFDKREVILHNYIEGGTNWGLTHLEYCLSPGNRNHQVLVAEGRHIKVTQEHPYKLPDGTEGVLRPGEEYSKKELSQILMHSPSWKEQLRKTMQIYPLPEAKVIEKTKAKKKEKAKRLKENPDEVQLKDGEEE